MLRDFELKGFKKFANLRFDNLGNVNIFLGRNNVGKTTVLESLLVHACGVNSQLFISSGDLLRTHTLTGAYDFAEKLLNAFYNKDSSPFTFSTCGTDQQGDQHCFEHKLHAGSIYSNLKPDIFSESASDKKPIMQAHQIKVDGRSSQSGHPISIGQWTSMYNGEEKQSIQVNFPNIIEDEVGGELHGHLNCKFIDILSHRSEIQNRNIYAMLKRENILTSFVSEISKIFDGVKGFDMLPYPDGTNGPVSVVTEQGYIPLSNFGDGLQRYFHIIGGLFLYRNGIHCIEEVDATFHPEAQEAFSKSLLFFSSLTNNQVFMSSHNAEFVDNFLKAVSSVVGESGLEKIRVITMKNTKDNQVRVRTLTGTEALIRRNDYEMELR